MLTELVYGAAGAGKSTYLYKGILRDLSGGKSVFLIVPDQEAVCAEAKLAEMCERENVPSFRLKILSFSRLCNDIFRTYGGISYRYIDRRVGKLVLFLALSATRQSLSAFSGVSASDATLLSALFSTVCEMKQYGVTPAQLSAAEERLAEDASLAGKVKDVMLIYAAYNALIRERFDDPLEDVGKAVDILLRTGASYFSDGAVYIDSFDGFIPPQYEMIRQIARGADTLTVSLCCEKNAADESFLFAPIRDMEARLRRILTEEGREIREVSLTEAHRFKNPEVAYLETSLRREGVPEPYPALPQHVTLRVLSDIFSEAEYVAADILKKIRGGARYRDMAVILRDQNAYSGVLDAVFEKYGIPYFFSVRTDLSEKSIVKFALSAIAAARHNFRHADVVAYMKTGLLPVEATYLDAFEDYIERWSLSGARLAGDEDYRMNPRGYISEFTKTDQNTLRLVNEARRRIMAPLSAFAGKLRGEKHNARELSSALYQLFEAADVRSALEEKYRRALSFQDRGEAEEILQLYNVFWSCVDTVCDTCGDLPVTVGEYRDLLQMVISETDIGKIPTASDEVLIGDAALIRATDIRSVYILGVNEGDFPKNSGSASVFSLRERRRLAEAEIEFSQPEEMRLARERFLFYRAVSMASSCVTLSSYGKSPGGDAKRPSMFFYDVLELFPALKDSVYRELPLEASVEGERASFDVLASAPDTPTGRALYRIYSEKPEYGRLLSALKKPVSQPEEQLSPQMTEKLFGDDLYLSKSKLERLSACRFNYFCHYVLRLQAHEKNAFEHSDIGTFVHYILQRLMEDYAKDPSVAKESEKALSARIDAYITDYLLKVMNLSEEAGELTLSGRLSGLVHRIRRNVLLTAKDVLREAENSRFIPRDFELSIGYGAGAVAPYRLRLPDGSDALLSGTADRVDVYRAEDGTNYLRIVDYKTGVKSFKLADVDAGSNLQVFMYAISISENAKGKYENAKPAAMIYMMTTAKELTLNRILAEDEIEQKASESFERQGVVLDQADVRAALETDVTSFQAKFKVPEKLAELFEEVKGAVREAGVTIKSGHVVANPKSDGRTTACDRCVYRPVCRFEKKA